ncbi:uncharacterized protein LOC129359395 isoform X2 [Poeciliopsis prolifica]|uniref:uncharacterized protein LOC129359395 isoform X2 n=1 Tax=Poeciliopsis prolifica TaxID=188132 RepID=UPI002412FC84|nr:uncharacterized protein LOC129359395 isoform X2 [Poeciliopsis prolifica]
MLSSNVRTPACCLHSLPAWFPGTPVNALKKNRLNISAMGFQQPCLRKRKQLAIVVLLFAAIMFRFAERYLTKASQIANSTTKLLPGSTVTQLWPWTHNVTLKAPTKRATSFIAVNMTKTLLVSAYLEHRTNPKQHQSEFLEVKNKNKKTESFNHTFTVCLSTMFDFNNVLQFVQSLEMLRFLGVSKVFVYKTSCSAKTQRVLNYYTRKGILEVIPWSMSGFLNVSRGWLPSHGPGDLHYFGQITALNDCLYRNMYRSKYVALHDVDELILPQTVKTWTELLPLLESKYTRNKCYMFENNVFPNNVMLPRSGTDPARWRGVPGVDVLAHLHQEPVSKEHVYEKFKIIVNPRLVASVSVHGVLQSHGLDGCAWVDRNIARMYHTRAQMRTDLTFDQLVYDGRLLSYSQALIQAVNATLRESGIL